MKCFRCCCLVLACSVLLSVVFSLPAKAMQLDDIGIDDDMMVGDVETVADDTNGTKLKDFHIYQQALLETGSGSQYIDGLLTFYPNDGKDTFIKKTTERHWFSDAILTDEYYIQLDDNSSMFKAGKEYVVTLENFQPYITLYSEKGSFSSMGTPERESAYVTYTDGTTQAVSVQASLKNLSSGSYLDFKLEFKAQKDVLKLVVTSVRRVPLSSFSDILVDSTSNRVKCNIDRFTGEWNTGDDTKTHFVSYEVKDENTSLLKGISNFLSNIGQSVTSGFENVKTGLSNVVNSVTSGLSNVVNKLTSGFGSVVETLTSLPQKIWEFIENGLKSLFVPSEEFMIEYKDNWDNLLSEKFGAVYQVIDVLTTSWERIQVCDEQNTIYFPSATIPLPEGNEFTFGGFDVEIVPDGFDFLADLVKTFTGIVCTFAFINGLKKRYDDIIGG